MKRLPIKYRKKMNQYDIKINSDKLNVSVVNEASLVEQYLLELKKLLQKKSRIVGLDCKGKDGNHRVELLVMCVSNRCLIIQCHLIDTPPSLLEFFEDESIPFVGMEHTRFYIKPAYKINSGNTISYCTSHKIYDQCNRYGCCTLECGFQLGDLASRVFKKPQLLKSELAELASHVDLKTNTTSGSQSSTSTRTKEYKWDAPVFSEEQVKEISVHFLSPLLFSCLICRLGAVFIGSGGFTN